MQGDKIDETVRDFREFINTYPKLRGEIRKSGRSWQEHYEKWVLLGEEDPYWEQFNHSEVKTKQEKTGSNHAELFGQLVKLTDNIDIHKVEKQVSQLNNTISVVQELLSGFISDKKPKEGPKRDSNVFSLFRD